jgi:hypothetical protein
LYYNNSEFNDGVVFLDGNLAINQNGSNIVNEVFTTPGDVLYTASKIYQDDSLFAQASGNTSSYPKPIFGTSTRRLLVTDSAGNTINDTTVDYNSSTNKTFSVVGGRTYYARGYTNFSYPSSATLQIQNVAAFNLGGGLKYYIEGYLSDAVEGDIVIPAGNLNADLYVFSSCGGGSELSISNNLSDVTLNKGFLGFFNADSGQEYNFGIDYYQFPTFISLYANGTLGTYSNGGQFTLGNTVVTVSILQGCREVYVSS